MITTARARLHQHASGHSSGLHLLFETSPSGLPCSNRKPTAHLTHSSMSLLAMPWLVVNLGCEMVYILEQRLKVQGIPADKSVKVLQDICRTMFDRSFVAEKLFVPQEMYSQQSTRKIFDRLAHSSIMRLSESSMDKLFDLMVMGSKYQLVASARPDDMIQVMLRHLGVVQAILTTALASTGPASPADAEVIGLISQAEQATIKLYGTLSIGELALLRHTLARFFEGKRVKVSLFLSEGIQLQSSGKLVAASCIRDQVGLVRSFGPGGRLEGEERLQLASQQVDVREFFCHPVPLGDNLYNKDRPKVVPPARGADVDKEKDRQQEAPSQQSQPGRYADEQATKGSRAAAKELDLLAALVNVGKAPTDNFRLNLFGDTDDSCNATAASTAVSSSTPQHKAEKQQQRELEFGCSGRNEGYIKALGLADVLQQAPLEEQQRPAAGSLGADLLDLMDSLA